MRSCISRRGFENIRACGADADDWHEPNLAKLANSRKPPQGTLHEFKILACMPGSIKDGSSHDEQDEEEEEEEEGEGEEGEIGEARRGALSLREHPHVVVHVARQCCRPLSRNQLPCPI
eukprot:9088993-Pyramimonas_sp.AAC.1